MDESGRPRLSLARAGTLTIEGVLAEVETTMDGLSTAEAEARRARVGPNAVRTHHVRAWMILVRQLRSALLILLAVTATVSFFLGSQTDALIIGTILLASVGLGFVNEFRAERAAEALHSGIRHTCSVTRGGHAQDLDVTQLVPGDLIRLSLGGIVPADVRLVSAHELACDESALTGESLPVEKDTAPVAEGTALADTTCCALMGTVVHAGTGTGIVVATGGDAEFGRIALGLGERQPETDFQAGLRQFSGLLLQVAAVLTSLIFVANLILQRPLIDALMFSLAIAIGITPQLLPAVVSTSLATGSRRLARRKVLVKRLVCIEDLGDMDLLVTDKTGTLTQGTMSFVDALTPSGRSDPDLISWGLLATEEAAPGTNAQEVGAGALDTALWAARPAPGPESGYSRLDVLPFDHARRMTSTLVAAPDGERLMVTKGAPEAVLALCAIVPDGAEQILDRLARQGSRVLVVATRDADRFDAGTLSVTDEADLTLRGFLVFHDAPKSSAAESLKRLATLGIDVKIATGDHPLVAERVCAEIGLVSGGTLTGNELDTLNDTELESATQRCTVFARVDPEQKARIVRSLRQQGRAVGFLGDGVNDALALHAADVGISVDTAADVAKDAADIILLQKDLEAAVPHIRRVISRRLRISPRRRGTLAGTVLRAR